MRSLRWVGLLCGLLMVSCSTEPVSSRRGTGTQPSPSDPFANAGTAAGASAGGGGLDFGNGNGAPAGARAEPATMVEIMTDEGECGSSSIQAEQVVVEETITIEEEVALPLDIYMIVDDSGSMVPWWPGTLDAINMFFVDPASEGIGVGVQFFGSNCDSTHYTTPRVPIAPLPGNTVALQTAFPLLPIEGTATVPAMQGAIQHARDWAGSHPDHKVAVLLVTDGLPDDCGSTVQGVVDVVREGFEGSTSIPTFVIGIGIGLDALNQFASAGGSGQAVLVQPGAAPELLRALQEIRDTVVETRIETVETTIETPLDCEWVIPDSPTGEAFDPQKVNVRLTSGASQSTPELGQVSGPDACAAGGWHYDDGEAPTRIVACEQTCDTIQSTPQAQVDILLGCRTIPLE